MPSCRYRRSPACTLCRDATRRNQTHNQAAKVAVLQRGIVPNCILELRKSFQVNIQWAAHHGPHFTSIQLCIKPNRIPQSEDTVYCSSLRYATASQHGDKTLSVTWMCSWKRVKPCVINKWVDDNLLEPSYLTGSKLKV